MLHKEPRYHSIWYTARDSLSSLSETQHFSNLRHETTSSELMESSHPEDNLRIGGRSWTT
ncbi:hypothetical protein H5410_016519 [Solanum commersonii]|uniref:Uncharacterized protein n=1 Tax=Solanum commersonii TaxID=4109 RepID=A0A9J5ZXW6_SOLCO|nr:hypothetical protein H5410_016519 [Solanum commersonii]